MSGLWGLYNAPDQWKWLAICILGVIVALVDIGSNEWPRQTIQGQALDQGASHRGRSFYIFNNFRLVIFLKSFVFRVAKVLLVNNAVAEITASAILIL